MPLTPFQKEVARVLARNRHPESHLAGGAILNRGEESLRYSGDFDIFHDAPATVAASAERDERELVNAGYSVVWTARAGGLFRAKVARGDDHLRLDWSTDSSFRFFPVLADDEFGYCLHRADLATNKVLALAGRGEIRDLLDILQLDRDYLSLGALAWAACGKDPGFTPDLLLQQANRHSRYQEADLLGEHLARPLDLRDLKRQWLGARERAEELINDLPPEDLGCLYVGASGEPVTPDPDAADFPTLRRHFGRPGGGWPGGS